ncbi:hypothetical protein GE09DRAFT_1212168 [Coniochaeta sp. 2T2.1]|nr:hypothetical protein GE09DRAFT_1212168 [Coniochaeta sp. 2T2.1]
MVYTTSQRPVSPNDRNRVKREWDELAKVEKWTGDEDQQYSNKDYAFGRERMKKLREQKAEKTEAGTGPVVDGQRDAGELELLGDQMRSSSPRSQSPKPQEWS